MNYYKTSSWYKCMFTLPCKRCFFFCSNTFLLLFNKVALNWLKVTKNIKIINVFIILNTCCSFEHYLITEFWMKCTTVKKIKNKFKSDDNKKCLLSILELFLKDHMTLKTVVMMTAEKSALHHRNKLHFRKHYNRKLYKIIFHNMTVFFINYMQPWWARIYVNFTVYSLITIQFCVLSQFRKLVAWPCSTLYHDLSERFSLLPAPTIYAIF